MGRTPAQRTDSPSYLRKQTDWKALLLRSKSQPVVVFKHSTRCEISCDALRAFEDFIFENSFIPHGIVNVVGERSLSDTIASDMGIQHESPQVIVIKDYRVVWHASHWSITVKQLKQAIGD